VRGKEGVVGYVIITFWYAFAAGEWASWTLRLRKTETCVAGERLVTKAGEKRRDEEEKRKLQARAADESWG
jgi:hypothetical protein